LPSSMVCTSNDELIVAGYTSSGNFPTSAGAFQTVFGGGTNDLFITSFDISGAAILGSTFIGGSGAEGTRTQEANVDGSNNIYLASESSSPNFPTTVGAFQTVSGGGFTDGVLIKMNLNCTALLASTYLGGSDADVCEGVQIAANGDVITTGNTSSLNFPTTAGAYQASYQGGFEDGFVTKFNSDLTAQVASTYVGTTDDDNGYRVQIDMANNIYLCGTSDDIAYPISPGVYGHANGRIFLQKFDNNLTTSLLSTKVGDTSAASFSFLRPTAFLLDVCENVYVSCQGATANLPLSPDALQTAQGGLWVTVLNPNFAGLLYASYIGAPGDHTDGGGSRFDPNGIIYQSACTNSNNFYNTVGAHSPTSQSSSWDIASTKIEFGYAAVTASFSTDKADTVCVNEIIQFSSGSASATQLDWYFGDGNTSTLSNPAHAYALPGIYTVSLVAQNGLASCSSIDTVSKLIYVADIRIPLITAYDDTVCDNNSIVLKLDVLNDNGNFSYSWSPAAGIISGGNTPTPTVDPSLANMYTVQVIHAEFPGYCQDTSTATLNILKGDTTQMAAFPNDTTVCLGEPIMLFAIGGSTYQWEPAASISNPTSSFIIDAPLNNKGYSVTISDAFGCTATKYCNVTVQTARADAGKDQIIRFGSSVTLDGSRSLGNTFTWNNSPTLSDNTILNPVASPIVEEEYTLTATTDLGCKDEDKVKIFVTNFTIPNAFTPNGDGNNDVFRVLIANDLVAVKSFRIYNRWGQNVYYTNNKFEGWDGTFEGTACDGGTYFYLLEVSIGNESYDYKGDISLIR
jgi:gliding motility-associated-like protein